jgi:hypothetical protein
MFKSVVAQVIAPVKRPWYARAWSAVTGRRPVAAGSSYGPQWLQQDAYKGTDKQWDPKAPPFELPLYGAPPNALIQNVNAALAQLEQGMFYAAAYMWDGMLRDDRLAAKSEERVDRLIGSPLDIVPGKDTIAGQKVADAFEEQRTKILPYSQLLKLHRTGLAMSVGIGQIISTRTETSRTPTLKVWNNRYLRYDWLLRKYCLVTENRGEIAIEPDDPEWIIYEPFGPYGWLDCAKIRSSSLPWAIRYWTRTWWARYQEVHGQPIRAGIIPEVRDPKDEKLFLSQISTMAHEAVIRLPQGKDGNKFDLKLVEAASNNWEGFMKLLEHCDDSLAIVWLGQSQSTRGQGGLGSQENAGESTITRIIRKDALIAEVLRDQLIKSWAADNYGDAELAPHLHWQIDPPADEKKVADTDLNVSKALQQFKAAGAPIDPRKYLESRGYGDALMTEEEHAAAKQQALEEAQAMMTATTPAESDDESEEEPEPEQQK